MAQSVRLDRAAVPTIAIMTPRSPLPQREGLDAAWVRIPNAADVAAAGWLTMRDFLMARLPARAMVAQRLAGGEFVDDAGTALTGDEPVKPNGFVWFHRPVEQEEPAAQLPRVIYRDENIVVADKPHFMATTPRGSHVTQTALILLRVSLGLPELAPAHRLDRLTAGVLVFTARREVRGAYATLFQEGVAFKSYEALAPLDPALAFPMRLHGRIVKRPGNLQAELVAGETNAVTDVDLVEARGDTARYRLTPHTGKTHQLRLQMASIGLPLLGDPLYPTVVADAPDDPSRPLQLIARSLRFEDPISGVEREFVSDRALAWPSPSHL